MTERRKKHHYILIFFLWISFLSLMAAIIFLSIQDGNEAKEMMQKIISYIGRKAESDLPEAVVSGKEETEYIMRQSGRAIAFFLLGMLGTVTVHMTFQKTNWFIKTGITVICLVAVAYFTEKVKIYLPTRHFSEEEMLISIACVILGFLAVSGLTFCIWIIGKLLRLFRKRD